MDILLNRTQLFFQCINLWNILKPSTENESIVKDNIQSLNYLVWSCIFLKFAIKITVEKRDNIPFTTKNIYTDEHLFQQNLDL